MKCQECGGCGWVFTERADGISGAARCPSCSRSRPTVVRRRPTNQEFAEAVQTMHGIIPFFPSKPEIHLRIATELSRFIDDTSTLDAFVSAACMEKWEGLGPAFRRFESLRERDFARVEMEDNARRIEGHREEAQHSRALPIPERGDEPARDVIDSAHTGPLPVGGPSKPAPDWLKAIERLPTREEVRKVEQDLQGGRHQLRTAEENKRIEEALRRELARRQREAS